MEEKKSERKKINLLSKTVTIISNDNTEILVELYVINFFSVLKDLLEFENSSELKLDHTEDTIVTFIRYIKYSEIPSLEK